MTRNEAIAELVRIWHSPHLDLILKASLGEVIETLKETNQGESLVRDYAENCKESESKLDLIRREDAIKTVIRMCAPICDWELEKKAYTDCVIDEINSLPSAEPKTGEWIPVKWHEITDEEREREGYPKDWVVYIDCEMPSDEQEILVQTKSGYVRWDVCYEEGEYSLDSGWDWIEDIVAWMPLPTPYKGGEDE